MFLDLALSILASLQGLQAYAFVGLLLFLAGIGAPLGQDVLLLAAAGTTLSGALAPQPLVVAAWTGIVAGDALTFFTGRHYGARWVRRPWAARFVHPGRLPAAEEALRRIAPAFAFVTRFLPGQRATLFFIAGTLRTRYRELFVYDGLAALVQVPLFVYGVRVLGWRWQDLAGRFDRADDVLTAMVALALLALWLRQRRAGS